MDTEQAAAFWSYVHDDDEAEGGRITELARDLQRQYGLLTGGALELFLDRDALRWGDDWRERIAEALSAATFFIPIMTPRYFDSVECRREVIRFGREAGRLGVESLVLPVLYVPVPDLEEEEPADEALLLLKPYHYENWTTLRFEDRGSGRIEGRWLDLRSGSRTPCRLSACLLRSLSNRSRTRRKTRPTRSLATLS
jgi:hypothetical protein